MASWNSNRYKADQRDVTNLNNYLYNTIPSPYAVGTTLFAYNVNTSCTTAKLSANTCYPGSCFSAVSFTHGISAAANDAGTNGTYTCMLPNYCNSGVSPICGFCTLASTSCWLTVSDIRSGSTGQIVRVA